MTGLYVYAVVRTPAGAAGLPTAITLLGRDGIAAAVRRVSRPPALDRAALRAHDAVVRGLTAALAAVMPVRFGAVLAGEAALEDWIASARPALERALDLVTDREQMMIRLSWHGVLPDARADHPDDTQVEGGTGPGARYLRERRRDSGWDGLPAELAVLRAQLRGIVAGERLERHATPPLMATAYHLLPRGRGAEYRAAVGAAGARLRGARLAVSGPWPAYAFAPESIS